MQSNGHFPKITKAGQTDSNLHTDTLQWDCGTAEPKPRAYSSQREEADGLSQDSVRIRGAESHLGGTERTHLPISATSS